MNRPNHECAPTLCGLGLTISSHICKFMNAELQLESEEGQGTRVTISIPLSEDEVQGDVRQRSLSQVYNTELHNVEEDPAEALITGFVSDPDEAEALVQPLAGMLPQPNRFSFILHQSVRGQTMRTTEEQKEPPPRCWPPEEEKKEGGGSCDCARVLIVDDDFINRQIMGKLLLKLGVTSETAENGAEGVRQVREANARGCCDGYRVVLMDLNMPIMDGIQAARTIRQEHEEGLISRLPIVLACTGFASELERNLCTDVGMASVVPKPVSLDSITEALEPYLQLRT